MQLKIPKRLLRLKLATLAVLTLCVNASAQLEKSVNSNTAVDNILPPSPEAAALGKYAAIPVGLYTGTPQIGIPVYTVTEGPLSLPLSFSYHASGHMVDVVAPRTGLGWTLNAGGVISRAIVKRADEYGNNGFLAFSRSTNPTTFYTGSDEEKFNRYDNLANCGDAEPDVFSFNFGGYTGRFVFNWNRQIVVSCDRKLSVRALNADGTPFDYNNPNLASDYFPAFEVTGDDGTVYLFEAQETTEVQSPGINPCTYLTPPVTSWYLTKIKATTGHWIAFSYQSYLMDYRQGYSESISHRHGYENGSTSHASQVLKLKLQYLSQITTSSGHTTIDFISGTTRRADLPQAFLTGNNLYSLDEIVVKNKAGQKVKHYKPEYDYSTGRLTLKKVHELPVDGSTAPKPPYTFSYSGSLPAMGSMVGSTRVDHWGFLNENSEPTLIPPMISHHMGGQHIYHSGGNREPSASGSKAGSLVQIKYPTGGTTTFEYEPHIYGFIGNSPIEGYDTITRDRVIIQHNGSKSSEYTTVPFTVGGDIIDDRGVYISVSTRYCSSTGFAGGAFGPQVWLYDANGNQLRWWSHRTHEVGYSVNEYLDLPPGNYYLKAWTGKDGCTETYTDGTVHNVGYDDVQAIVAWKEFGGIKKRKAKMAGGIRIKKITDYDGISTANNIVRTFDYTMVDDTATVSAGVISGLPKYDYYTQINEPVSPGHYNPIDYLYRVSSNCVVLSSTQGSHIGYRKVTVNYGDKGQNGKSESYFSSFYDAKDNISYSEPFQPPTTYDYLRGQLEKQVDYKWHNNQYVRVKQIDNEYASTRLSMDLTHVPAYKVGWECAGQGPFGADFLSRYAIGHYSIILDISKLKSSKETLFEGDKSFTTERSYTYNSANDINWSHKFLLSETVKTSDGKELITEYTHPFRYDISNSSHPIWQLNNKHMLSTVIEKIVKEKAADGTQRVVDASFTDFGIFGNNVLPRRQIKFTAFAPVTDFRPSMPSGQLDSRYYREVAAYNRYNNKGMPEEIATPGSNTTSYLWDADGSFPIAKITNASFNNCAYTSFENNGITKTDQGNWFLDDMFTEMPSGDAKTGNRSFKGTASVGSLEAGKYIVSLWAKGSGTITVNNEQKTIDGTWKLYQWVLTNPGQVSVNTNGNLIDELRLHPVEARMRTFTYQPGIGVSSITDETIKPVYYEYDGLGRLKLIKDHKGDIIKHYRYQYKTN